jgi:hypothetical protein
MGMSKPVPRSRRERGAVATELAIALPLLLLILGGVLDLGMLYWAKQVVTNASREGARAATTVVATGTPGIATGRAEKTKSQIKDLVQTYLRNFSIKNADGSPITLTLGGNFTYEVDASYTPNHVKVGLINIPVKMMLLPQAQQLFTGTPVNNIIYLDAKTSMAVEWTIAPP